jgi:phosphatidylglycerol lysyltransferase
MNTSSSIAIGGRQRILSRLPLVLGIVVLVVALIFINSVVQTISFTAVNQSFWALQPYKLALALVLTVASFAALSTYDILAFGLIGRSVPKRTVAAIAAASYAFSQALGYGTITGGAIRYRLYSTLGVPSLEIAQVTALSTLTFLLGISAMAGVALLTEGESLAHILSVRPALVQWIGGAIALGIWVYVGWRAVGPDEIMGFGFRVPLPGLGGTLAQLVIAVTDVSMSAAALWVLLPDSASLSLPAFAGVFAALVVTGIVLHIPGSLGVLEAGVVLALPESNKAQVLSAVLAFRAIYYLLPFGLASAGLALLELRPALQRILLPSSTQRGLLNSVAPTVIAGLSFLSGMVLLLSGATPALQFRMDLLSEFMPLPLVEASHLTGSVIGFMLLVLASALYRRLDGAWLLTVCLLAAGIAVSLAKGLDFEEATVLAIVLGITFLARPAFYRRSSLLHDRPSRLMLTLIVIGVVATIWITFLAFSNVPYSADQWWQVAWDSQAPRSVRAGLTTSVLAVVYLIWLGLRPSRPPFASPAVLLPTISRIIAKSPDPESNLALAGNKHFLLSDSGDAFIMYAVEGNSWIAMGDPVGNPGKYEELLWRYLELVDRFGGRPIFYQISSENVPLYLNVGLRLLKIGEEAIVEIDTFSLQGGSRANLRHAVSRAKRNSLTFEVVTKEDAPAILPDLESVSAAWLSSKRGQEKQFSVGHFDPDYMLQFDQAVVRQNGRIIAFANIWDSAGRAFCIDLMRYRPDASNGLMDFLFCNLILWGKQRGYESFSLGMAPLSGLANHPLAPTWHRAANLLVAHAESIYGFAGLRSYKEKFRPSWRPRYLALPGSFSLSAAILDLTILISRPFPADQKEPEKWSSKAA